MKKGLTPFDVSPLLTVNAEERTRTSTGRSPLGPESHRRPIPRYPTRADPMFLGKNENSDRPKTAPRAGQW